MRGWVLDLDGSAVPVSSYLAEKDLKEQETVKYETEVKASYLINRFQDPPKHY